MAKAKSKKITIEDALVPVEEQPYEVPENWCWVSVYEIVERLKRGKAPKYVEQSDIPVFAQKCNQKDGTIAMEKAQFLNPNMAERIVKEEYLHDEDIIINSTGTGTLGRVGFYKEKYALPYKRVLPDSHITVVRAKKDIVKEYLYLFLKSKQDLLELSGAGTTNQKELRPDTIGAIKIPLPPKEEQQRIVEQIESLFSKLDEARDKIQEALEGFDLRRASVLYDAFNGRLTAKWREEKNIALNTWKNNPLEEVFRLRSGSTIDASEEQEKGSIPYVKVADMNMEENQIQIVTSSRFVDSCAESHEIPYGSTIFPKRGGAILTNKKRYVAVEKIIADLNIMAVIPIDKKIDGWYGYYWMQSIDLKELNNGSNVPQINNKDMVRLNVPTPSIEEQKEIVRILDIFFEQEREAYKNIEYTIEAIDLLKKSILAKAFRGELGTNNPSEESSIELLKQIIANI